MRFRERLMSQAEPCTIGRIVVVLGVSMLGVGVILATTGSAQAASPRPASKAPANKPAAKPVPTTGPAPKLRCDEPIYDFGEVWAGERVQHDFILHNDGQATLKIKKVQATCGCTATKNDKEVLPGQTGKVHATLSTRGRNGKLRKSIYAFTDDPTTERLTLTLVGKVKTRINMQPSAGAQFGAVKSMPVEPITVKLTNNTQTPMKIELDKSAKKHEIFRSTVKEIEPGKVYHVIVSVEEPFLPGRNYYARLPFKTGIKEEPVVKISCRLSVPRELDITRSSVMLGSPPQRNISQHTDINYNGVGKMNLLSVTSTNEQVKPVIQTLQDGRKYRVTWTLPKGLDLTPEKPIHIKIATDYEKQPEIDIPIRVRAMQAVRPRRLSKTAESLIGQQAPRVAVKTLDGSFAQLGKADRKVKAVNFWATYCPHSRRQLPMVQRIGSVYRHRGVEFLMVNMDEQRPVNEIASKAKALGLDLPVGLDTNHRVSSRFGINGQIPTLVLIGKSGEIEAVHRGFARSLEDLMLTERQITAELDALLEGQNRNHFPKLPAAISQLTTIEAPGRLVRPLPNVPSLAIESLSQDTGAHKPGAKVQYTIYYRNDGQKPLTISKVSGDTDLKIDPGYAKALQPTMSGAIKVEFNVSKETGEFRHQVTIESNSPGRSPLMVNLTGEVLPYIQADPAVVDFTGNARLHAMPRIVMLTYNGSDKVKYLEAKSDSSKFEVKVQAIEGTPYAKLVVRSKPPFDVGENRSVIHVKTDCPQQRYVDIPVSLLVQARVDVKPDEVILLNKPSDRQVQSQVVITNNGDRALHVLGVSSTNEVIRTLLSPLPDGKSYKLQVTFPPGYQPGPKGDKVTIKTDDPAEYKEIVIPVRLQGR